MKIEYEDIELTPEVVRVNGGLPMKWEDIERLLAELPAIASLHLRWFPLAGPPSDCANASEEMKRVREALFDKRRYDL